MYSKFSYKQAIFPASDFKHTKRSHAKKENYKNWLMVLTFIFDLVLTKEGEK